MKELFISVDIETTGLHPDYSSMISIGAAAFLPNGTYLESFEINLLEKRWFLPPFLRPRNKDTMKFWGDNQVAWERSTQKRNLIHFGIFKFRDWLKDIQKCADILDPEPPKLVFLGYRAGFDFTFMQYYFYHYLGEFPFGYDCLDMRSFAMALMKEEHFDHARKKYWPSEWNIENKLPTHIGVNDAINQGRQFFKMMEWNSNDNTK